MKDCKKKRMLSDMCCKHTCRSSHCLHRHTKKAALLQKISNNTMHAIKFFNQKNVSCVFVASHLKKTKLALSSSLTSSTSFSAIHNSTSIRHQSNPTQTLDHLTQFQNKRNTNMKAILVNEFGGPEVCQLQADVPIPEPNANQV